MVKRLMILAVLAGSLAITTGHAAFCPGASAGHRGGATVPATEVGGSRQVTVTLDARWIDVCDDGSIITGDTVILGAPTKLTITGDQSCSVETKSDWDPFGFAVGVHDTGKTATQPNHLYKDCNIDISWSGFGGVYLPDPARSGPVDGGVRVTASKATNHENGAVFVGGVQYLAHGAAIGTMWTGVGVDAE